MKMQQRYGFQLREVNIADDPALLAEYGTRIPLIFVDGHLVCKYFMDETAVAKRLRLAVEEKPFRENTTNLSGLFTDPANG
jgi:hypothetical protein